jgi:hypothetical protein
MIDASHNTAAVCILSQAGVAVRHSPRCACLCSWWLTHCAYAMAVPQLHLITRHCNMVVLRPLACIVAGWGIIEPDVIVPARGRSLRHEHKGPAPD